MTLVLGLTGGIATGKSTADKFLRKKIFQSWTVMR